MESLQEKLTELRRQEEEKITRQKAGRFELAYLTSTDIMPEPTAVGFLPEEKSRSGRLIVIKKTAKNLWLALTDPENETAKKILSELETQGYQIKFFLISLSTLQKFWDIYKMIAPPAEAIAGQVKISGQALIKFNQELKNLQDIQKRIEALAAGKTSDLVEIILAGGLKTRASDIHTETTEENVRLRYRIDGILHDLVFLSFDSYQFFLSRIKLLSGLKLNIREAPQDGRFTINLEQTDIEVRASCLPSAHGENLVLRLLNPKNLISLEGLGLRSDLLELLKNEIKKPNGMLINTGPTGSGKTTTLYACLNKVNQPGIKIITLEDPIEYHLAGITQTQIEPEKNYNFTDGLRSVLRHDPDIILVGEIRDKETAKTAIQAALTGHLLFTTLHTNDAAGAIPRLLELEANPANLAPALNLIMAQRLVRRLCPKCKEKQPASAEEIKKIKKALEEISDKIKLPKLDDLPLYRPVGCAECSQIGYLGQIAIFEMLSVNEAMEKIITKSPSHADILDAAKKQGLLSFYQDGLLKVIEGITSIDEIERVAKE